MVVVRSESTRAAPRCDRLGRRLSREVATPNYEAHPQKRKWLGADLIYILLVVGTHLRCPASVPRRSEKRPTHAEKRGLTYALREFCSVCLPPEPLVAVHIGVGQLCTSRHQSTWFRSTTRATPAVGCGTPALTDDVVRAVAAGARCPTRHGAQEACGSVGGPVLSAHTRTANNRRRRGGRRPVPRHPPLTGDYQANSGPS